MAKHGNHNVVRRNRKHDNWYYLDLLPPRMRLALCGAVNTWDAKWFHDLLKKGYSVDRLIDALQDADRNFVEKPIKVQGAVGKKWKAVNQPTAEHGVRPLYQQPYL